MLNQVYILNGPNLNMLGKREPEIYGSLSLDDIQQSLQTKAQPYNSHIIFRQTNAEGQLVDWIQEAGANANGLIINPGAYTHTSIALLDALLGIKIPAIEVHLSNIYRREDFRHNSYVSKGAAGVICGLGAKGYELAFEALLDIISRQDKN